MKKKATVTFRRAFQASQKLGGTDEHMVAKVVFDLEVDGQNYNSLVAHVKQTVGSEYKDGVYEVSVPGHKGPFNYTEFQKGVVEYYQQIIGIKGSVICADESSQIIMENCVLEAPMTIEFEVSCSDSGW